MDKTDSNDDKLLLKQIAEGNEKAFSALVKRYWNNIYSQALTYVKSTHKAQDIVQEVFVKIWLNRENLANIDRFDSYIFIIARNHILSELRKKFTVPLDDDEMESFKEESAGPDKLLSLKGLQELIARAVQLLPPQQKAAFKFSRDDALSYEEIAAKMDVSRETVKKHICKALNFLRTYIRTHAEMLLLFIPVMSNLV